MKPAWFCVVVLLALPASAAERMFRWRDYPLDQPPQGFRSTLAGVGTPGEWKVMEENAPPLDQSAPGSSPATNRAVLAQTARVAIGNHFPMLIFEPETYDDFRLTTRFKITGGALEQIAGVVFRFQNESNFYAVAANAAGGVFRCYKMDAGEWKPPFGAEVEIAKDVWHELSVQCEGTRILCALDGKELIKLVDNTFAGKRGRIGFWTKSDSVGCFADTRIEFTQREILAQSLVRDSLQHYSRVVDLQVFAVRPGSQELAVVAGKDEKSIGQPGGKTERAVINEGIPYYARGKETTTVTIPLQDRNGEPIAAVRVVLTTVTGQTQDGAVARARPVVSRMQTRVRSLEELLQ